MSLAILERETPQPQFEVLVDSVDDLRLLYDGLTNTIADQRVSQRNFDDSNEHKLELAESLREQIAKDFEATQHGKKHEDFRYTVDDRDFVLEAIAIARQNEQPATEKIVDAREIVKPRSVQALSSNHTKTARLLPQQRITSFYDPRLDEKPRRWFRR